MQVVDIKRHWIYPSFKKEENKRVKLKTCDFLIDVRHQHKKNNNMIVALKMPYI